jgi:HD-like signal output (HDOD) protein
MINATTLAADACTLPPLSQATFELLPLLKTGKATSSQIEKALVRDPALAANLLRLTNSPAFGLGRQVASLTHAITLVGQARLGQLALTMSLQTVLPNSFPGYGISKNGFLAHSVAVAILTEKLGQTFAPDPECPYFVAGLLHDVGKLLLARYLSDRLPEVSADIAHHLTLIAAERDILGTDHTEVASILGKTWHLPPEVTAAALGHHFPDRYLDSPNLLITDIVHVADATAHSIGFGQDVAGLARSIQPGSFQRLGVRASNIERVVSECLESVVTSCRNIIVEESS